VTIEGSEDALTAAALDIAEETGVWLFESPVACPIDGLSMFEITVRGASLDLTPPEAADLVARLQMQIRRRMAGSAIDR
jgi:hypothetical protein